MPDHVINMCPSQGSAYGDGPIYRVSLSDGVATTLVAGGLGSGSGNVIKMTIDPGGTYALVVSADTRSLLSCT